MSGGPTRLLSLALLSAIGACRAAASPAAPPSPAISPSLERIQRAVEVGDEDRARAEISAALVLAGSSSDRAHLARYTSLLDGWAARRSCERDSRLEGVRDEVTLGDVTELMLTLAAPTIGGDAVPLTISLTTGGSRTSLLASVTVEDFDAYGSESSRTETVPIALKSDLEALPGEPARVRFLLDGLPAGPAVVRRMTVSAELVPAEALVDGNPVVLTRLAFSPATVLALPSGYEAIAERPLESLDAFLARPEVAVDGSILPATFLVPAEEREVAMRKLARALSLSTPSTPRARALIVALRHVTGDRDRGLDAGAWLGWATALSDSLDPSSSRKP